MADRGQAWKEGPWVVVREMSPGVAGSQSSPQLFIFVCFHFQIRGSQRTTLVLSHSLCIGRGRTPRAGLWPSALTHARCCEACCAGKVWAPPAVLRAEGTRSGRGERQQKPAAQPLAPVDSRAVREFVALGSRDWEAESQDTVLCVATRVLTHRMCHGTHIHG